MKKVVIGETCVIALMEKGQVVSWGKDKNGCLGLGNDDAGNEIWNRDNPSEVPKMNNVIDIQMGQDHVVALKSTGEVFCWGNGEKGQLGDGRREKSFLPIKVEHLANEQIVQIAVVRNSTFALSSNGVVYAWGDNKDNVLGLGAEESVRSRVETPLQLTLLGEMRVRKLEVYEGRTIIAHVRGSDQETSGGLFDVATDGLEKDEEDMEIFKGIDQMRKTMEKTQEWWNHLLNIKHGQPYDLPHETSTHTTDLQASAVTTLQDDMEVALEKLQRAERHLDALVNAAVQELKRIQQMPGTRNVRFILCMFIDECRLRREKVQRTISARQLVDVKQKVNQISAYSVTDFGSNSNEEVRKIVAVTKEIQMMFDSVKTIRPVDVFSQHLQVTLMECLECKLQLYDTRIELLKVADSKPTDPLLPALRIIKDRWDTLKQFSLYALYLECEKRELDFGNDDEHLSYLVKQSNAQIDQMIQIDKDRIISHDTMVPSLCYDLLRENAELRKMTNSYQLHVLMLYQGKHISDASVGMTHDGDGDDGGGMAALTG